MTDHNVIQEYCDKHSSCDLCHKRIRLWCKFRSWIEKRVAKFIKRIKN